jgi:hypothetical protein
MSSGPDWEFNSDQPRIYQIKVKGHLGARWSEWLDNLTITRDEDGNTLLTGPVPDDAALHGLLKKVRDLGTPLLSVNCIDSGRADEEGE